MVDNFKTEGEWKNQLGMAISIFSFKDLEETRTMHIKSDNIEILIGIEADEIIDERFNNPWVDVNLFLIVLICCIISSIK